jgi:Flp pilus assembly protein TadB
MQTSGSFQKFRNYILTRARKQGWYHGLDRAVVSARMKIMTDDYIVTAALASYAVGLASIAASIYLYLLFQGSLTTIPDILTALRLGGIVSDYAMKVLRTIVVYAVMVLIPILLYYAALTFATAYPGMVARERGKAIDEKMPAFVSHMAIMLQNNAYLLDAFKYIEKSNLYGEIGEEIGIILNRASFNINFIDAINHVALTTSSYELRKFLSGIVETTLNLGTLDVYLRNASENLSRMSLIKNRDNAQSRAALVEIYTIAMVMMPLMILLTLMTTALMGQEVQMGEVMVYGYIPLGTFVFILMEERNIRMKVKEKQNGSGSNTNNNKNKKQDKTRDKDKAGLKEKIQMNEYLNSEDGRIVIGIFIALPIFYLMHISKFGVDTVLLIFFAIAALPYALYWHGEASRIRKEEEVMPVFLRNVSDRNRMGFGIIEIFEPSPVYEHINKRVERIYNSLKMGESLETAVEVLKDKRSFIMTRAAIIINDALRAGGNISRVLESVAEDIQNQFNTYREVEGDMKRNTKMIIATYLLFIGIVWIINNMFFKSLAGIGGSGVNAIVPLDTEYYKRLFYHGSALAGISAGLVMGKYEKGDPRLGLVFSAAFALVTVAAFNYI